MWLKVLIPLIVFFSFSSRTPKIQPNPQDHEYAFGMENKYYQTNFVFERENGQYYKGDRVFIQPTNWTEFEHYKKEAYDIDNTSIRALYQPFPGIWIMKGLKVGGSANWQHYKNCRGLGVVTFKMSDINIAYESNFNDRTAFSYKAGIPIPLDKVFNLDMGNVTINFYSEKQIVNHNESEQNKIVLGYNFKKGGGKK